ncbi:MAG: TorF family putative porin [Gammaproteobacteria bacterium]
MLASPAAMAGPTGNAGAFTTYMFRGIDQSLGGAAQGGADYSADSGLYAGTWISTTSAVQAGSAYETDFYGGWTRAGFDVGYIFYGYRDLPLANFSEVYAGWSGHGVAAKVYFSPEFSATEDSAIYATASYAFSISDSLTLTPQVGFSTGDGVEAALGGVDDSYVDYSLTLAKSLKDGFSFSLGYIANTLDPADYDDGDPDTFDPSERGQIVVGLKKTFEM